MDGICEWHKQLRPRGEGALDDNFTCLNCLFGLGGYENKQVKEKVTRDQVSLSVP